ncbi:MAG: flagellar biosynthetic protein FliR [Candidatus Riflebacteria bacterium]|nr:flagellar biosynthetic protein FliR [Candidatus Riflebacteria bacterium]
MTEASFLNAVGIFLISLLRFSGFFLNIPVYSEAIIPMQVKAGLSALCAVLILPHLVLTQTLPELTIPEYGLMALKELALGFSIGYVVLIFVSAIRLGGQIIGMQIGFSFVQVADPTSSQGLGIVSEFFQLAGSLTFLFLGGHLLILQAFFQSFELVPLAGMHLNGGIVEEIALYSRMSFVCGLQIAMPVIAVILVGDVALGIIARTVPKMNIFQVGFSLKILGGLAMLIVLMPYLGDIIKNLIGMSMNEINLLLSKMG